MLTRTKKYIVGNWKMNTDLSDAMVLGEGVKEAIVDIKNVEVVLCPPFVWLYPLAEMLKRAPKHLSIGAQNMFWEEQGAFTGEVSPLMLKNIVKYVILGHSERRYYFGETDELINDKVLAAFSYGLTPILCVGERAKKGAGSAEVISQVEKGLSRVTQENMNNLIIAYEPVWAIGTGDAATGEYAADVALSIRRKLAELYNDEIAGNVPILYGGSVTRENINEFIDECEIDGALVGGVSLKINDFVYICKIASEHI